MPGLRREARCILLSLLLNAVAFAAEPEPGDTPPAFPRALTLRMSEQLSPLPPGASAAPVTIPQDAGFPQTLIAAITLNGEDKGERMVHRAAADDFLLRRDDLAELTKLPAGLAEIEVEGMPFVRIKALPGAQVEFDVKQLALNIVLPPEAFPKRTYDLANHGRAGPPASVVQGISSGLFNYRLHYFGQEGGQGLWSLGTEQAVAWGSWLLRNQSQHLRSGDSTQSQRFATELVHDDREHLRRWVIGDSVTGGQELSGSVGIGGLSFSKAYQLSPYFVRQPSVGFAGSVTLPSEVDFYVGDARVLRQSVGPGPFEIENFRYYGGQRDVRVVIRDMLGREQVVSYPFYFADDGLAAGLHDYSYQLGLLRDNFGASGDRYGDPAYAFFHRYGISDGVTLGLRGEGSTDYGNLGPSLVWRNDWLGVLSVNAAGSWDRVSSKQGRALAATYSFRVQGLTSQLSWRGYDENYAMLHSGSPPELPSRDVGLALGYARSGLGSLSADYRVIEFPRRAVNRVLGLNYSRVLFGRVNLLASYRHVRGEEPREEIFVGLLYVPDGDKTLSAIYQDDGSGNQSAQAQMANTLRSGEGLGYRLTLGHNRGSLGAYDSVAPELQYQTRLSHLTAEVRAQSGAGAPPTTYAAAMAGSVAAVGGRVGFSRPIRDSFALAEITPPLAGVRVYQSSQEVGRTGADGRLFLPDMTSFVENYVSINDKDIPIEYGIERAGEIVAPAFRSGSLVKFPVRRTQSLIGSLKYRAGAALRPLEYHQVILRVGDRSIEFVTGRGGEWYLENVAPGTHAASVRIGDTDCEFNLVVPESVESFVVVGEVMSCDVTP